MQSAFFGLEWLETISRFRQRRHRAHFLLMLHISHRGRFIHLDRPISETEGDDSRFDVFYCCHHLWKRNVFEPIEIKFSLGSPS